MKGQKLFKRSLALTCVGTMLVSSATVFAAPTSSTGSGSVENDNSVPPSYINVVLPTITPNTYDFTIDTEGLLKQFGNAADYGNGNVYFSAVKTAAKAVPVTSTDKFYEFKEVEDTSLAKIEAELVQNPIAAMPTSFTNDYYVWQPDTTDDDTKKAGTGHWTQVTPANVEKFLDITYDTTDPTKITAIAARTDAKYGDDIWDGKIYVKSYVAITAEEAAAYITVDGNGDVSAVAAGLYVGDVTATVSAADTTNVTYTPAVFINQDESQPATIKNRSSEPVAVSASISLPDNHGLTFQGNTTFTGVSTAALCMQISNGTPAEDVAVTGTSGTPTGATAYYMLMGASGAPIKYQDSTFDQATGSHNYYQYVASPVDSSYEEIDFTLKAAANGDAAGKAAWVAYIDSLRDANSGIVKPDIEVVYDFQTVKLDPDDTNNLTYVADNGAKYTITTANTSGTATRTAAPTPTAGYVLWDANTGTDGVYWLGPDPNDSDAAFAPGSTLTSLTVNGKNVNGTIDSGNWLVVEWSDIVAAGEENASKWVFVYTVSGTTYTATDGN